MVMMTVIAVVALAVLISLFHLYFNKIRKNVEKHLQLLHKMPYFHKIHPSSLTFFLQSFFQLFLYIDNLYIPK